MAMLEDLSKAKVAGMPAPMIVAGLAAVVVLVMVLGKPRGGNDQAQLVGGPGSNVAVYQAQLGTYEKQMQLQAGQQRDAMAAAISLQRMGNEHELATFGAQTQRIGVEGQLGNQRLAIQSGERVSLADIGARERVGMADVAGRTQVGLAQVDAQRAVGLADISMRRDLGMRDLDIKELGVKNSFTLGMRGLDIQEKGLDYGFQLGNKQLDYGHKENMFGLESNRIRDGQVHDENKQQNTWNGWTGLIGAVVNPIMKLFGWA